MTDNSFGRPNKDISFTNAEVQNTLGNCATKIRAKCLVADTIVTNIIDSPDIPNIESGTFTIFFDMDLTVGGNVSVPFDVNYLVVNVGSQRLITLTFGELAPNSTLNSDFVGLSSNVLPSFLLPAGPGVRIFAILRRTIGLISGTSAIEILGNGQIGLALSQTNSFYGSNSGPNATSGTLTPTTNQWFAGQQPGVHTGATITYVGI